MAKDTGVDVDHDVAAQVLRLHRRDPLARLAGVDLDPRPTRGIDDTPDRVALFGGPCHDVAPSTARLVYRPVNPCYWLSIWARCSRPE